MEMGPAQLAQRLIDLVVADEGLPTSVREHAGQLRLVAEKQPDLAISRLDEESQRHAVAAEHEPPTGALAKAVPLETYWEHYIAPEVKALFPVPEGYRRYLDFVEQPENVLARHVRSEGTLIEAPYSWLAPYEAVEHLSGAELIRALELGAGRTPPLVLLVLHSEGLADLGVGVRRPRATDAVVGRHTQWRPSGLASGIDEFIDKDIPVEALARIEWRP